MQAQSNIKISKLAIIAGGGELPMAVISHCQSRNIPYVVLPINDHANLALYKEIKNVPISLGEVGKTLAIFKKERVSHTILVGSVMKPNFFKLKLDAKGALLLAKITKEKFLGDDNLLRLVIKFIESHNVNVIGLADLALTNLFSKEGVLGNAKPSKKDLEDIEIARNAAEILGKADIGQGLIIENKIILAVEAIEGTDELLRRTKHLKICDDPSGILVKVMKPQQTKKADLPTIGIKTVQIASEVGLKGIAISAKNTLIINEIETIKCADKLNIFIFGF